jgi:hypothetical protein
MRIPGIIEATQMNARIKMVNPTRKSMDRFPESCVIMMLLLHDHYGEKEKFQKIYRNHFANK